MEQTHTHTNTDTRRGQQRQSTAVCRPQVEEVCKLRLGLAYLYHRRPRNEQGLSLLGLPLFASLKQSAGSGVMVGTPRNRSALHRWP